MRRAVDIVAEDVAVVHNVDEEDSDDWKQDAVCDLREENRLDRAVTESRKDDTDEQNRTPDGAELRRREVRLPAECTGGCVRAGQRSGRRAGEPCGEQSDAEKHLRVGSDERFDLFGHRAHVLDIRADGERRGGGHEDSDGDETADDDREDGVGARFVQFGRAGPPLLDASGVQKEVVADDGRPNETGDEELRPVRDARNEPAGERAEVGTDDDGVDEERNRHYRDETHERLLDEFVLASPKQRPSEEAHNWSPDVGAYSCETFETGRTTEDIPGLVGGGADTDCTHDENDTEHRHRGVVELATERFAEPIARNETESGAHFLEYDSRDYREGDCPDECVAEPRTSYTGCRDGPRSDERGGDHRTGPD
ncbi:hypothetical protein HFX_6201 (plasmid) [Haloferax mediterranei ATCC 33500]|uniref:Uncharacterized protein n=1 Tax=Haloferax mediterranei (strain ATCC 33500 / DSM 1411 / JCM 8866 / NBRC 14739 / NCIMB 2177 / R-4) TaxID=523841 RepID=I3RAR5_HALMT|nr:hypothetical protein HFX_6201 [Haloferax mediterranei ATCC 33500]